jgi:phosphoribosylformimino-5-aminoimidazole carboxamide ribotide isomerase
MSGASGFEILPAIDLRGGRIVRLRRGDFDQETAYGSDPAAVARAFIDAGARWIHLVDLDGARSGRPIQADAVRAVIEAAGEQARVELAGGLRTIEAATSVLESGAARVVLGTVALADPGLVGTLVSMHGPDRIAVAIDVRDGLAVGHGWTAGALGTPARDAIAALADAGVTTFEVTAIERDGMLGGPDLGLYELLAGLGRGDIIASGGIAMLDDLRALRTAGCVGAILGRALYEGSLDLAAALRWDGAGVDD